MKLAMLSGGVGGARLARGMAAVPEVDLTVVVNVGDDDRIYGLAVSPDLDTVLYTMAGRQGPHGWGIAGDEFAVMNALDSLPMDTSFRIGDRDLATNLFRTDRLEAGWSLTWVTTALASAYGVEATVLPATDHRLRTQVKIADGTWLSFQEYFVTRRHRDDVHDVSFDGAATCRAAPGVIDAIESAEAVVVGPSNPVLSIWPILAVRDIAQALAAKPLVIAVSPLIGGSALKGPAHRVLDSLGFGASTQGVASAYGGLLTDLVIDQTDAADAQEVQGLRVHVTDTLMSDQEASIRLATSVTDLVTSKPTSWRRV